MKKRILFTSIFLILTSFSCNENSTGPEPVSFEWEISSPESQGMNSQLLDSALTKAGILNFVDGLIVIRNGKLIVERYFNEYETLTPHNVKSVSKSFLSALIGIAINKGIIPGIEKKVMDYFPEYIYQGMDARKFDITIKHLLTMQMGIDKEENIADSIYYNSSNWVKSTLELPLLSAPGEKFRYNTLETHLLSVILTKASGMSTLEFAKEYLFDPMGITIHHWMQDPQGYYFGGSEMGFTPREMAVFGYLYLNRGGLNGIQIVPSGWIDSSYEKSWSKDAAEWGVLTDYNYGFLWWIGKINGYDMDWALGYGGQTILIFPDLNLIVVSTAIENTAADDEHTKPILEIVSKYILPAVTG
jgi:CubicO group peptidase (beta-lactamase class C family)